MAKKDLVDENDIMVRLESSDLGVFQDAYKELCKSAEHARQGFGDTAIYACYKRSLDVYTPKYESLLF